MPYDGGMFINRLALALGAVLAFSTAQGSTLTFNDTIPLAKTNYSGVFTLNKFDSSLGTLLGVTLTLNGMSSSDIFLESTDAGPSLITADTGALVIANTLMGILSAQAMNSTSFNAGPFDGSQDFGGLSGTTILGLLANKVQSLSSVNPAVLAGFTGPGQFMIGVNFRGQSTAMGDGNFLALFRTLGGGTMTVMYDFAPTEVPEPMSLSLVGCGLIGFGWLARRRQTLS